jgi:hypothetical protein
MAPDSQGLSHAIEGYQLGTLNNNTTTLVDRAVVPLTTNETLLVNYLCSLWIANAGTGSSEGPRLRSSRMG